VSDFLQINIHSHNRTQKHASDVYYLTEIALDNMSKLAEY
jgi:hypothetical protein